MMCSPFSSSSSSSKSLIKMVDLIAKNQSSRLLQTWLWRYTVTGVLHSTGLPLVLVETRRLKSWPWFMPLFSSSFRIWKEQSTMAAGRLAWIPIGLLYNRRLGSNGQLGTRNFSDHFRCLTTSVQLVCWCHRLNGIQEDRLRGQWTADLVSFVWTLTSINRAQGQKRISTMEAVFFSLSLSHGH